MKSFDELDNAIAAGTEGFKEFISKEEAADKNFLGYYFRFRKNQLISVLNYLIYKHQSGLGNPHMEKYIKILLKMGADFNSDNSIHLVLQLGKRDLLQLFPVEKVDYNSNEGRSLLSRVIDTQDNNIVAMLKTNSTINIHKPSTINIENKMVEIQPLHQAVVNDFPQAIYYLLEKGAVLDNTCGELEETPLLLAARLGKIKALGVLLAATLDQNCLDLEATNKPSERAIDLLCKRLQENKNPQEALYGIAMLLYHGAEAPRNECYKSLLIKHRFALIDEVAKYKNVSGRSVFNFVNDCHDKNNPLHDIIYANTWYHAIWRYSGLHWVWHLAKLLCDEAFRIEKLIYNGPEEIRVAVVPEFTPLDSIKTNTPLQRRDIVSKELELDKKTTMERFSQFVWRYSQTCTFFKSPFSTMYNKLNLGDITEMSQVINYAESRGNERTTTLKLLNAMNDKNPEVHQNLLIQSM